MTISVVIADDQPLIRSALRALIEEMDDITVVGEAADGTAAVAAARRLRPDIVLMDIRMPGADGLGATETIRDEIPDTQVIVLTTYHLDEYVFRAVRAGAAGFLLKDGDADELVRAVRVTARGEALMTPAALRTLLDQFAATPHPDTEVAARLATLTEREREVLRRMADGDSNAEIATSMYLGVATVKTHVSSILTKLGARDRTQAVVHAYRAGLR